MDFTFFMNVSLISDNGCDWIHEIELLCGRLVYIGDLLLLYQLILAFYLGLLYKTKDAEC